MDDDEIIEVTFTAGFRVNAGFRLTYTMTVAEAREALESGMIQRDPDSSECTFPPEVEWDSVEDEERVATDKLAMAAIRSTLAASGG